MLVLNLRNLVSRFSYLLTVLAVAACSAGGTGSGGQNPPPPQSSSFSFTQPSADTQIADNVRTPLTFAWISNGSPVADQPVTISITQGQLIDQSGTLGSSLTVMTAADGTVVVDALSSKSGAATIAAAAKDPTSGESMSATLSVHFVGPPSTITVQAPSPIPLKGTSLISAVVKDADGNALQGISVGFSVPTGGALSVSSSSTDATGTAQALFTPDGTGASVSVQVSAPPAPSQTATIQVTLGGPPPAATLTFSSCPSAIPSGSQVTCTLTLLDSDGKGIADTAIGLTSSTGTLTAPAGGTTFTTAADGTVQFVYAAGAQSQSSAQAILTATAQVNSSNITQTQNLTLDPVDFEFTAPAANTQLPINSRKTLAFKWTSKGTPVSAASVTLSVDQGSLVDQSGNLGGSLSVATQADGTFAVDVISGQAGAATVTAMAVVPGSNAQLTTTLSLSFVGPPNTITVQAPSPIAANGVSLITAVVDDSSGNALVGIPVSFSIASGGSLSSALANTDSSGIARSLFTPDGTAASVVVQVSAAPAAPQSATINVTLAGSGSPSATLTFSSCPATIPSGSQVTCTLSLLDNTAKGIANTIINLSASSGTVNPAAGGLGFTTGADGAVQFVYASGGQSTASGQAILTASTQVGPTNITQTFNLTLDPVSFGFIQPASTAQLPINVRETLSFQWIANGQAVASAPVIFSTNSGALIDSNNVPQTMLTKATGANGIATAFDILSTTTGSVTVTAQATDSTTGAKLSTTFPLTFVGQPSSFVVNAPSPIPGAGSSLISVTVADSQGTRLSGITVNFSLPSQTPGGSLSTLSSITDTTGTAQALFTPDGSAATAAVTVTVSSLAAQTATIQIGS
jgi:hypothetical protein